MCDGGNTCTPVGSGAVDEQFWALVCEDEEWLDSEFAEIVSEGNMALMRAVDKFSVDRGFKFSTYACRAILKAFSRTAMKSSRHRCA